MRWDVSLIVRVDGAEQKATWLIEAPTANEAKPQAVFLAADLSMQVVREAGCVEHPAHRRPRPTFARTE